MREFLKRLDWRGFQVLLVVWNVAVVLFLLAPLVIVTIVSFNPLSITFPPEGFTFRWYGELLQRKEFIDAAWVSLFVAILASLVSTTLGTMAGISIVRFPNRFSNSASLFLLSPLLVPSIILALAIYQLLVLLYVPRTIFVLVLGHILITMPFPVRTSIAILRTFDPNLEDAAFVLGASRFVTFRRITLPIIRPGIIAGFLFAFIVSWNEFTMSLFLVGPGTTTLPLQIYAYIQYEYKPVIAAMSSAVVFFSGLTLFVFDRLIGLTGVSGGVQRA